MQYLLNRNSVIVIPIIMESKARHIHWKLSTFQLFSKIAIAEQIFRNNYFLKIYNEEKLGSST